MPEITEEQRKAMEDKIKNMSPEELKEFQKQQCIFCQIIAKKIPSKIVYEDHKCIGILDINPASKGHILLLPKEHYSIMPQVSKEDLNQLILVSKYLSQVILKTIKAEGTNIFIANGVVAGQRAQHFMLHIIPRREADKILDIPEKLIDGKMVVQVKSLVEKRFNEIMGIKKEQQQKLDEIKKETKEPSSDPMEEKKTVEYSDNQEIEKPIEVTEEDSKLKKDNKKTKDTTLLKENSKSKNEKKNNDSKINLDDIANLFK